MSLPTLAELPGILLPFVTRAEQSFREAVQALENDHGLAGWAPERWAQWARVSAASDFVIEQSVRDPLMLLTLVQSGELDRAFAPGELCAQIAAAVKEAQTEDELGRAIAGRRQELGSKLLILGHHYQRDEVIEPRFQLPAGWRREGVVVQVADGNYHELVAHLARTHLVIEGVAMVITVTTNLEHFQLQRSDTELIQGKQRLQLVFKRF